MWDFFRNFAAQNCKTTFIFISNMMDLIDLVINSFQNLFGIGRDAAVGAVVSIAIFICSGLGTLLWYFIKLVITHITKRHNDTTFRYVSRRKLKPTDIMHDRGEVINGFDAKVYFPRPEVDSAIEQFMRHSKSSNILVVTGLISSGKSRAVYEALKKSKVRKIALCYDSKNVEWTLGQWIEAIDHMKKNSILCLDSISDIHFEPTPDKNNDPMENWAQIFEKIHTKGLRCIVTLAQSPKREDAPFATTFLSKFKKCPGDVKASASFSLVEINEIKKDKTDVFYQNCKSHLLRNFYSPVVGDYIAHDRYCQSIWEKLETKEQAVRMFVSILLALKYNKISHNIVPSNYLKKVYFRLAADSTEQPKDMENAYNEACKVLEEYKIIRTPASKAVCIIQDESSFEYIKEKLFLSLDTYHNQKLGDINYTSAGIAAWVEPYIRRNNTLYIEKKQADLIISIDQNNLSLYKDAVVFSSNQNMRAVAEYVRMQFNSHFFDLDQEKNPLKLKDEFKPQMEDLCDFVGVLVSRSCSTAIAAKTLLEEYLHAGIEIHEDIVCELLRIAAGKDITTQDRNDIKKYATELVCKLEKSPKGVEKLLAKSTRFNSAYESLCEDYDAERIKRGFILQANNLIRTFDVVKKAFQEKQEIQLEPNSNKTYLKLWENATRSLRFYCKKLTERIHSTSDFQALVDILNYKYENGKKKTDTEIITLCEKVNDCLIYINPKSSPFVFMQTEALANLINAMLAYNPMGYIEECEKMAEEMFKNLPNTQTPNKYIINEQAIFCFVGRGREEGVMGVIPDYKHAAGFYKKLSNDVTQRYNSSKHLKNALNIWLYPLFDKIKNEKHLDDAKKLLLSPKEMVALQKEHSENIDRNRKLVNRLILDAPSYASAEKIYNEYQSIVGEQIDTINILLGHIKEEVRRSPRKINYIELLRSGKGFKFILQTIKDTKKLRIDYIRYTKEWISVIEKIEWNKFSTNGERANGILTSISERLKDEKLTKLIKNLELPSENQEPESRLTKELNAIKEGAVDRIALLSGICDYYSSTQGEDMYEESDYITHLIQYTLDEKKQDNRHVELRKKVRTMVYGNSYQKPIDELIAPKQELYEQIIYKIIPKEEYDFNKRWEYVQNAYLNLYACKALPPQGDKQVDLLYTILKPIAYDGPDDAIEKMQTDVYNFVKEHPVFITMFMACICKLVDLYVTTYANSCKDEKMLQKSIIPILQKELDAKQLPPTLESVEKLTKDKLDRINEHLLTLEFDDKPMPFDERFTISLSTLNAKIKNNLGEKYKWYMKGPFDTFDDTIRHKAWDCYVATKTSLNYLDIIPKIIFPETARICQIMKQRDGSSSNNFEYLKKEFLLLKEICKNKDQMEVFKDQWEKHILKKCIKQELPYVIAGICNNMKVDLYYLIELLYIYNDLDQSFDKIQEEYKTWWDNTHKNSTLTIPTLFKLLYGQATTEQKEDLDYMRPELSVEFVPIENASNT